MSPRVLYNNGGIHSDAFNLPCFLYEPDMMHLSGV